VKNITTRLTLAKCTVLLVGQTFSTHLGGGEGRSPVRRGCGAQPYDFFGGFLSIFGNRFLFFEDRIVGNRELQIKSDGPLRVSSRDKD